MKSVPQGPGLVKKERLCHWTPQDTYYFGPHCEDTESKLLYLIYRNKPREAAKMRRKGKHGPNERTDQNSRKRTK